jgi:formylglycine-generating enzyme required for sulfatase activity
MKALWLTLVVVGLLPLLAAPAEAKNAAAECAPDAVQVGPTCVDTYEASVWSIPAANTKLITKVQAGTATLADLTAGGATQVGPSVSCSPFSAFPSSFDLTGNWTAPLYAASIAGVSPTACATWFQAEQACALSGKRLLTNQEWQRAAAGTPDPGTDNGTTDCNISAAGGPVNTGSRAACVSNWGAKDMVGNVWEWVGDWGEAWDCITWSGTFGSDVSCRSGIPLGGTIPGVFGRGGAWFNGTAAGVFAVGGALASDAGNEVGFRCAR